jgi:hypothetical protein
MVRDSYISRRTQPLSSGPVVLYQDKNEVEKKAYTVYERLKL